MLASGGSTVQQQQQQQGEPGAAVQPSRRSPPKKNLSHSEHFVPEAGSNYFLDPQNRWAGDFIQEEQRRRAERLRQKEVRGTAWLGREWVGGAHTLYLCGCSRG